MFVLDTADGVIKTCNLAHYSVTVNTRHGGVYARHPVLTPYDCSVAMSADHNRPNYTRRQPNPHPYFTLAGWLALLTRAAHTSMLRTGRNCASARLGNISGTKSLVLNFVLELWNFYCLKML